MSSYIILLNRVLFYFQDKIFFYQRPYSMKEILLGHHVITLEGLTVCTVVAWNDKKDIVFTVYGSKSKAMFERG